MRTEVLSEIDFGFLKDRKLCVKILEKADESLKSFKQSNLKKRKVSTYDY